MALILLFVVLFLGGIGGYIWCVLRRPRQWACTRGPLVTARTFRYVNQELAKVPRKAPKKLGSKKAAKERAELARQPMQ